MNAIQKLTEIEAEKKLNKMGLYKTKCPRCHGWGMQIGSVHMFEPCFGCEGDGVVWESKKKEKQK